MLNALEDRQVAVRIVRYFAERFDVATSSIPPGRQVHAIQPAASEGASAQSSADLFEQAQPQGEMARVLTIAYFVQILSGQPDWDSLTVNNELKHLGYGVSNITKVLDRLIGKKPQLVIQTRKSGSTRQARKRYKLTREGARFVERRISGDQEDLS